MLSVSGKRETILTSWDITSLKYFVNEVLGRGGVGFRGRREVCASCGLPVFLAERLVVGAPGQLVHRTCFRCARCSAQLTLASYYQTERGQYCCETCPDEERPPAPPSPALASAQHLQTDTDEDSSSEEEEESEEESEAPRLPDTPAPTPSPTPPRPRTVFLSQTLVAIPDQPQEQPPEQPQSKANQHSPFSEVSPALFGSVGGVGRVREHSPDPAPYPRTAKSLRTDPPKVLDTGQPKSQPHPPADIPNKASTDKSIRAHSPYTTSSSIVARRLQMFQEISNEGDKMRREEKETTSVPSITVTSETVGKDGKKSSVSTPSPPSSITPTQPSPITAQKTFKESEKKEEERKSEKVSESRESFRDSDQVVSEAEEVCHREESEVEKSHLEEESEPEKSLSLVSEVEKGSRQADEPEKDQREKDQQEKDQVVKPSESQVVSQTSDSSDSHTGTKNAFVSPSVDHSSPVVTSREPHTAPSESQQYPDDLNPFGSEDEEEEETGAVPQLPSKQPTVGSSYHTTAPAGPTQDAKAHSTATGLSQDSSGRKLIKANLNPFESDEEEEEVEAMNKDTSPAKKEVKKSLNPFWSDDEEEEEMRGRTDSTAKGTKVKPPRPPPPSMARNRSPSTVSNTTSTSSTNTTPRKKKIAPPPPSSPQLSIASSPGGSIALRKKGRRAPAPPMSHTPEQDTCSIDTTSSGGGGEREDPDEVLSWKLQKDLKNHSNKLNGTSQAPPKPARSLQQQTSPMAASGPTITRRCSTSKSEAGEWKRKKGPAPPRPVPQKRALKKLPMKVIQQELQDIDIKQTELERQGVLLETQIRKRTEASAPPSPQEEIAPNSGPPSSPNSIEVEDMIMQLFELVNEKNELFRRQTELMYLKREKRLEEEHVELEYQIRCLMMKSPSERTEEDTAQEEELISRLVKVVEQRDEIINCLELDRLREAQEDESIATHMMQYQEKHIDGMENDSNSPLEPVKKKKTLKLPKKKKKKEKKGAAKGDADKDVDESETPTNTKKKKKKKWLF
ncbi:MICAL-like protein 1 isoform X3 [Eriocheir sinensis]|uniref:MICAL-like protein 1 isoform X3 n=1 Tax=Eriocheir sinensis TaxID=95602 RepID=UPI0021C99737|nr:MICAL-like protein 1 isoform X3 [Eriocheir sinensis]